MGAILGLVIIVACAAIYFLPTIIAVRKKKANTSAITLVNLFLGWTLVGWFIALLWAVSNQIVDDPTVIVKGAATAAHPPAALCSRCGKYSPSGPKFCPHCGAALA
jgi:hypothetical protein